MVEYILIVTIVVSFIISLRGFFSNVKDMTNNYMGDYIICLMDFGELPSLGSTDSDLNQHTGDAKCNVQFKAFTIASGRPPVNGNSSTVGGGGKNNQSKTDQNPNASSSGGGGGGGGANSPDDRSASGGGGGRSGGSPYSNGSINRSGRGTADGIAAANSKTKSIDDGSDEGDGSAGRGSGRQSRTIYKTRDRYKAITGQQAEQIEKQLSRSTNKRVPSSRSVAKVDTRNGFGPRSGVVTPPEPKPVISDADKQDSWTFGALLKWLLIIAIIVVILMFFGGQIMNYSNSDS